MLPRLAVVATVVAVEKIAGLVENRLGAVSVLKIENRDSHLAV